MGDTSEAVDDPSPDRMSTGDDDLSSHTARASPGAEDGARQTGSPPANALATSNVHGDPGPPRVRPATSGPGRSRHGAPRAPRRRESPPPPPPPPEFGDEVPDVRVSDPPTAAATAIQSLVGLIETTSGAPTSQILSPDASNSKNDEQSNRTGLDGRPDCAICLQACVHPVQLPCQHIFCFLCAKGAIKNSRRCAMCRSEVPSDYLDNPLLLDTEQLQLEMALSDGYQWFYEGRNGWWKYDERTAADLEAAFTGGEKRAELLVAGYRYVVDFETMLQLRRSDPARRRRVKRDLASAAKKGVAGIRVGGAGDPETGLESALQAVTLTDPPPPLLPAPAPPGDRDAERPADGDGSTQL